MSARFFKIFSIVFIFHVLMLTFIWVGFSAPSPRPQVVFIYQGSLPDEGGAEEGGAVVQSQGQFVFRPHSLVNPWINLRDVSR